MFKSIHFMSTQLLDKNGDKEINNHAITQKRGHKTHDSNDI